MHLTSLVTAILYAFASSIVHLCAAQLRQVLLCLLGYAECL